MHRSARGRTSHPKILYRMVCSALLRAVAPLSCVAGPPRGCYFWEAVFAPFGTHRQIRGVSDAIVV
jgi:hypothetical protein